MLGMALEKLKKNKITTKRGRQAIQESLIYSESRSASSNSGPSSGTNNADRDRGGVYGVGAEAAAANGQVQKKRNRTSPPGET